MSLALSPSDISSASSDGSLTPSSSSSASYLSPKLTSFQERIRDILELTKSAPFPSPGLKPEDETKAIVWRGLTKMQLLSMMKHQSAGGKPANPDTGLPNESQVIDQVGERGRLPEFTLDPSVAERFGTGNLVAAFEIDIKYLIVGSVAEKGVVCNEDAPITLIAWKKGKPFIKSSEIGFFRPR